MGDLLNDIIRLYDTKRFFVFFILVVAALQWLAFQTYGSFYWYLGDYLWYLFVFFGLVNFLILTRRRSKQKLKDSYQRKLSHYKDNFIGNLKLDTRIYDVIPSDVAVINDQPIKIEGRQEHMEKMREFLDTVKKINQTITDHWPDEDEKGAWDENVQKEIFASLKVKEDDIDQVKQSKEALKFWFGNYVNDLKKMRTLNDKAFESVFEKGILALTPIILMLVIALQLANITNKLLYHVYGTGWIN